MSRLSRQERNKIFEIVAARDGLNCFIGYEEGDEHTLFLHQWDCNPDNHSPESYRILCAPMIRVVCPWIRISQKSSIHSMCVKETVRVSEPPRTTSLELLKSMQAVPLFCHWTFNQIVQREEVPFDELLDSASAVARISQATGRRYIARDASPVRIYVVIKRGNERVVRLRPEWEGFRKVLAERRLLDEQARNWRKEVLDGLPVVMGKHRGKKGQSDQKKPEEQP
jgi:hypothetical protein